MTYICRCLVFVQGIVRGPVDELQAALGAISYRIVLGGIDVEEWAPVLQSMQLCLELVPAWSSSQLEGSFNEAFADWKGLDKKAKLGNLLRGESASVPDSRVRASHRILNWDGVQFERWEEALQYIEKIVFASNNERQCYLYQELSLIYRSQKFECKGHYHEYGMTTGPVQKSICGGNPNMIYMPSGSKATWDREHL
ncbi:hypothetical protein V502_09922 [Pseudogymnoascus sp. VKM F-4520 (FW-2644)]|nr:hypothetical protein V502_09922 [Pseudogymnoascus sp. VKM F-4520 (FW-2644)]